MTNVFNFLIPNVFVRALLFFFQKPFRILSHSIYQFYLKEIELFQTTTMTDVYCSR